MGSVERIDTSNVGDNNQHHDKADAANQRSVETIGDSNKDVQQWFSELSVEERCSALGFVDGPLLSVVLKHASLSIAQSTTASTCSDNRVADKQGQYMFYVKHQHSRKLVDRLSEEKDVFRFAVHCCPIQL